MSKIIRQIQKGNLEIEVTGKVIGLELEDKSPGYYSVDRYVVDYGKGYFTFYTTENLRDVKSFNFRFGEVYYEDNITEKDRDSVHHVKIPDEQYLEVWKGIEGFLFERFRKKFSFYRENNFSVGKFGDRV